MKQSIFCLAIMLCSLSLLRSQDVRKIPLNYTSFALVFDATNMSGSWGLEYERIIARDKNLAAGLRGNYVHSYTTGNADISLSGYTSGYADRYAITLAQLWLSGYAFTSRRKDFSGFFLSGAVGTTYSYAKRRYPSTYYKDSYAKYLPGGEIGAGTQFAITDRMDFRSSFTFSISGRQNAPSGTSPLTLLSVKIGVGF